MPPMSTATLRRPWLAARNTVPLRSLLAVRLVTAAEREARWVACTLATMFRANKRADRTARCGFAKPECGPRATDRARSPPLMRSRVCINTKLRHTRPRGFLDHAGLFKGGICMRAPLRLAALSAAVIGCIPFGAHAQLEEIVVTATRRETDLQEHTDLDPGVHVRSSSSSAASRTAATSASWCRTSR